MFDTTVLNSVISGTFCNLQAQWISELGSQTLNVALDEQPIFESEESVQVIDMAYQAETNDDITGMKRGQTLTINSDSYLILSAQTDHTGWSIIRLEKQ